MASKGMFQALTPGRRGGAASLRRDSGQPPRELREPRKWRRGAAVKPFGDREHANREAENALDARVRGHPNLALAVKVSQRVMVNTPILSGAPSMSFRGSRCAPGWTRQVASRLGQSVGSLPDRLTARVHAPSSTRKRPKAASRTAPSPVRSGAHLFAVFYGATSLAQRYQRSVFPFIKQRIRYVYIAEDHLHPH